MKNKRLKFMLVKVLNITLKKCSDALNLDKKLVYSKLCKKISKTKIIEGTFNKGT